MNNILAVLKKELRSYFNSPIAYIIITVFLAIAGWFFATGMFLVNEASVRNVFGVIPLIFIFFIPAITMRLISEEKKIGTIELMLTMPLKDSEIILGKFFASVVLLFIALLFTLVYVITISLMGNPDGGPIWGGYIGLLLMGSAYLSIGIYASSITENQIVSFIVAFIIIFIFFMMDKVLVFVPAALAPILEYMSIDFHFNNITRGVIDSRDVIYYLSLTIFALSLASHSLSGRKWS